MAEFDNGNPNNTSDYDPKLNNQSTNSQNPNNQYVNNQYVNGQSEDGQSVNSQNTNNQGTYQQNPYNQPMNNKLPEYSFWAEQMPGGPSANNNQGTNSWEYGNNQDARNQNMNYQNANNQNANYQYSNNQYSNYQNSNYNNTSYQNVNNQNANYQNTNYQNTNYQNGNYQNMNNQYSNPQEPKKKERKQHKMLGFIGKSLCFGLIAGLVFVGINQVVYAINPNAPAFISQIEKVAVKEPKYEIGYTSQGAIKEEKKSVISSIVDKTMPSIVTINCTVTQSSDWFGQEYDQEAEASGSGFIVGKDDKELLIATNNHVVEGATKITVTFNDGATAEAVIKGTDATADLAVVSIDISKMKQSTLEKIAIAKLGNSDQVKVGEMAIAIGNALGYGQSVTVGYISAKDREVDVQSDNYSSKKMVLLQTDAAINPGNSGGALLNVAGEVIGINTIKYASNEIEGMGYAIPISKATTIINELMTREIIAEKDQGYLGIAGNDVTEDVASIYNLPIGVFINEVSKGGAAEKGGLLPNDVITKVDNIEITSITQLREYVTSKRVGTDVKVTYMRKAGSKYKEQTATITLGKNPSLSVK